MGSITASQLKGRLAELLEVSRKQSDEILSAFEQVCTEAVSNGDSITLPGIGKLDCQIKPARMARNPRTGEPVKVKAKVAVKFKVAKSLQNSAPSLTSKKGKALLAEAEEKQAAREKARRKRERAVASSTPTKTKKKLTKKTRVKAASRY